MAKRLVVSSVIKLNQFILNSEPNTFIFRVYGYTDIQLVDVTQTTVDEQRTTDWMTFHSLVNFLDQNDATKTVEGHPAPKRAIVTARAP